MATQSIESLSGSVGHTTKRGAIHRRYKVLENDRSSWRSHYMELSDYILPRRGRFLLESQNSKGRKRQNKIIDSTGSQAIRTMAAGMMSGLTSPARPWFRLGIEDDDKMQQHQVLTALARFEKVIRGILNKSNYYNNQHINYFELGVFGTCAMYRRRSPKTVVHYNSFTAGEYVIAEDDEGVVDTLGREFQYTVSQVVEHFLVDPLAPQEKIDWSRASKVIKSMWDRGDYDALVPCVQMIQPRRQGTYDPFRGDVKNKRFMDVYIESGAEGDQLLQNSGHDRFPAYVARWDVLGGDVYGRSPGMETLPDIKQLQLEQKRKAQAIDKMVNPPMTGPTSLKGKPSTVLPGGTTYLDVAGGQQGFQPAYLVTPRIAEMVQDIQEVQGRIRSGTYADLFAQFISQERTGDVTATEIVKRHEEVLVLLGPVLQRLNTELLNPQIEDAFAFALENNMLGDIPEELQGEELNIKYISLLAQAQEAVSATTIERSLGFAGNLVQVFPDIIDNINSDKAYREYTEVIGTSPDMLRSMEDVNALRQARSQQQAQQAQMEQATQAAQAAKLMSETDTQNPNALTAALGGVGGGARATAA